MARGRIFEANYCVTTKGVYTDTLCTYALTRPQRRRERMVLWTHSRENHCTWKCYFHRYYADQLLGPIPIQSKRVFHCWWMNKHMTTTAVTTTMATMMMIKHMCSFGLFTTIKWWMQMCRQCVPLYVRWTMTMMMAKTEIQAFRSKTICGGLIGCPHNTSTTPKRTRVQQPTNSKLNKFCATREIQFYFPFSFVPCVSVKLCNGLRWQN